MAKLQGAPEERDDPFGICIPVGMRGIPFGSVIRPGSYLADPLLSGLLREPRLQELRFASVVHALGKVFDAQLVSP